MTLVGKYNDYTDEYILRLFIYNIKTEEYLFDTVEDMYYKILSIIDRNKPPRLY